MDKIELSKEMAIEEFEGYCKANNIDCDESEMDSDDKGGFADIKRRFVKAYRQGRVAIDGRKINYQISDFSPSEFSGQTVTVSPPGGAAMMAMDGYKETQNIHKLQAFVSAMTGKEIKWFAKLDKTDWDFFKDAAILFLSM